MERIVLQATAMYEQPSNATYNMAQDGSNTSTLAGHEPALRQIPKGPVKPAISPLQLPVRNPDAKNIECDIRRRLGGLSFLIKAIPPAPPTIPTLQLSKGVVDRTSENIECVLQRNLDVSTTRHINIADSASDDDCSTTRFFNEGNPPAAQITQSSSGEVVIPTMSAADTEEEPVAIQDLNQASDTPGLSKEDLALAKQLSTGMRLKSSRPPIPSMLPLERYCPLHNGQVESLAYIVHAYEAHNVDRDHNVTVQMKNKIAKHLKKGDYMENYNRCREKFSKESPAFCKGDNSRRKVIRPALKWFDNQFSKPL